MATERTSWLDLSEYHTWEDAALLVLGAVVLLSPWIAGVTGGALINAIVVGAVVAVMAIWQMAALSRWQEIVNVVAGAWLIISPFVFQYGGALALWHFIFGALVALLAIHELWQDSRHPDKVRP